MSEEEEMAVRLSSPCNGTSIMERGSEFRLQNVAFNRMLLTGERTLWSVTTDDSYGINTILCPCRLSVIACHNGFASIGIVLTS